jgi:type IV pilus assembly protein PilN
MIRINLLPNEKKRARRFTAASGASASDFSDGVWGAIYGSAVGVWALVLAIMYFVGSNELEALAQQNQELETRRNSLQSKTQGLAEVEGRLERSRRLEKVVHDLDASRTGPTRAVMELSRVLSEGQGPSIDPDELERMRKDNPLAGYNEGWDVRRLWLTNFEETERECRISGMGRSNDDVAEFLRRLTLSELFDSVTLERTRAAVDDETGVPLVGFDLTCRVNY